MTTAMEAKKASVNSGSIPSMVVTAAMVTGRTRLTAAWITASWALSCWPRCTLISSISTMAFFSTMPIRLKVPSSAMKVKGAPSNARPPMIPISISGTIDQIASAWRSRPNSSTVMMNMPSRPMGSDDSSAF